jgi:hypothetical protein
MSITTVRFTVADEDQKRLGRLVKHFGGGDQSAYLRAMLPVIESLARAERLRELQVRNADRAAAAGQDALASSVMEPMAARSSSPCSSHQGACLAVRPPRPVSAIPSPTNIDQRGRPVDDQLCERARCLPINRRVSLRVLPHREGHVRMADARAMAVRCLAVACRTEALR